MIELQTIWTLPKSFYFITYLPNVIASVSPGAKQRQDWGKGKMGTGLWSKI